MKYKNLVYASTAVFPSRTAHSVHVTKMSESFLRNFDSVHLLGFGNKHESGRIHEFYNVSNKIQLRLKNLKINRFLSFQISLITLNYPQTSLYYTRNTIIAFFLSKQKKDFIYELHDFYPSFVRFLFEPLVIKSKHLRKVVVISKPLKNDFEQRYGTKTNIEVHHDGSDDKLAISLNSVQSFNKKIGYVGSLYQGRGIELILELAKLLPSFEFHIAGGSSKEIMYYKSKHEVKNNVIFHGFISQKKLIKFYEKVSLLLMPYQEKIKTSNNGIDTSNWMSPLKLFEYMSTGLPIISSDLQSIKSVVSPDFITFAHPSDITEWKMQILEVEQLYKLKKKQAEDLKVIFLEKYTWDKRAINILKKL